MRQIDTTQAINKAFSEGYIIRDFLKYNQIETQMRLKALREYTASKMIYKLFEDKFIDRLTYVREYYTKKSINFMIYIKDKNGLVVGVGHFTYNKDTRLMLLREYQIESKNRRELLKYLIYGARDTLREHGFKTDGLMISKRPPSYDMDGLAMLDMRIVGFRDDRAFHKAFEGNKSEETPSLLLYKKFVKNSPRLDKKRLHTFLKEMEDGNELEFLLKKLEDPHTQLYTTKLEGDKLVDMLENI